MNVNAYTGGMAAGENFQVIFREAKIDHANLFFDECETRENMEARMLSCHKQKLKGNVCVVCVCVSYVCVSYACVSYVCVCIICVCVCVCVCVICVCVICLYVVCVCCVVCVCHVCVSRVCMCVYFMCTSTIPCMYIYKCVNIHACMCIGVHT